jgi:hypothetical protein
MVLARGFIGWGYVLAILGRDCNLLGSRRQETRHYAR